MISHQKHCYIKGGVTYYILFFAMIFPVFPAFAGSPTLGKESKTSRPGNEYRSFYLPAAYSDLCLAECAKDSQCKTYTYLVPLAAVPGRCFLKTGVPNSAYSNWFTSGFKSNAFTMTMDDNADRFGLDYTDFDLAGPYPELCLAACARDDRCMAYSYMKPAAGSKAHCWLKTGIPGKSNNLSFVSGYKNINPQRFITFSVGPAYIKQGDLAQINVNVGDSGEIAQFKYNINSNETTLTFAPSLLTFNTCKDTGTYYTSLSVGMEGTYRDGETIIPRSQVYGLTAGMTPRENSNSTYAVYLSPDDSTTSWGYDSVTGRYVVDAFIDEFDSYTKTQDDWADFSYFFNDAKNHVNGVDMAIFIGHGMPHGIWIGNLGVSVQGMEFGAFAPCGDTGDLEYLVLLSCDVLSIDDPDFGKFWFHRENTKFNKLPFTGLHMVLSFRTGLTIGFTDFPPFGHVDNDAADFVETFAENLDDGMKVINAWQEAAMDELDMSWGVNKSAVLYLNVYKNDTILSNRHDYIYMNPFYGTKSINYFN
jgi:hypothetical protein